MRRRPIPERIQHPPKPRLNLVGPIPRNLKRLQHHLRLMIPYRPARKLNPITNNIILKRLYGQRVLPLQRRHPALRHRKRIMRKHNLLLLLIKLIHRKIHNPTKPKFSSRNQPQILPQPSPHNPRKLRRIQRLPRRKKHRIPGRQPTQNPNLLRPLRIQILSNRPQRPAFAERNIPQPPSPLRPRPLIQLVKKRPRIPPRTLRRNRPNNPAPPNNLRKQPKPGIPENLRHIHNLNRVPQIRLIRAIP